MAGDPIVTLTMNPSLDVSAEVSSLAPERKLRSAGVRHEPGGGGINVARGVHRLNGDVCALYPAGGGIGRMLTALLEEEGVACQRIPIQGITRQAFSVFVQETEELYHFVLPGPEITAGEAQQCLDALARREPPPGYVVASGSLPQGIDDDFYAGMVRSTPRARVLLDCHGAPLKQALEAGVFLAKPNLREFCQVTGSAMDDPAAWRQAARDVVQRYGVTALVITLGADGALLTTAHGQTHARPPVVETVSPVGAGDSFMAAMVTRLAEGTSLEEALGWGVAGAAAAVRTPATELFHPDEIHRLHGQVHIEDAES